MLQTRKKNTMDQVFVITGASSGIGLATALLAAKKGARVVLASRNEEELGKITESIKRQGGKAIGVKADVSQCGDLENLKEEALKKFGRIDVWVNNAGASIFGPLFDSSLEEEKQLFETNFWGVRHGCKVALPELERSKGVLINIGSEVSGRSIPYQGLYAASKHAVKAYTDALRMELEAKNSSVAVSLIRPAGIDTPFTEHAVNHLPSGAPSLPAPVYHPNAVAEAIIECARSPKRDVYIGAPARLFTIMEVFFPRLTDFYMKRTLLKEQSQGALIPHTKKNEGLIRAPYQEGKLRGGYKGHVFSKSLYTRASLHPWATLFSIGILTGLLSRFLFIQKRH